MKVTLCFIRAWLCYQIGVRLLPCHPRPAWMDRLELAILPYAGDYAYWNWRDRLAKRPAPHKETDHA